MDAGIQEREMAGFQGEVIRDDCGREVVCFTTPSGVRAIVATCIQPEVLAEMARKLKRRIAPGSAPACDCGRKSAF